MEKYQKVNILGKKGSGHSSENTKTHITREHEICLIKIIQTKGFMNQCGHVVQLVDEIGLN